MFLGLPILDMPLWCAFSYQEPMKRAPNSSIENTYRPAFQDNFMSLASHVTVYTELMVAFVVFMICMPSHIDVIAFFRNPAPAMWK